MQFLKTQENYIIRLEKGEKIIEEMTSLCENENILTGYFSGIGAVLSAEVAFYDLDNKKYLSKNLEEPHEITSLTGNVAVIKDRPFIHAHCVLSNKKFECMGGHLKEAVVGATCEIYLFKESIKIKRKLDEKIGLNLLDCV